MSFPKLVPAFTAKIPIKTPAAVGSAKGGLSHVAFAIDESLGGGSFTSEPGYSVPVDALFVHGADFIRSDVDGKHLRLNVSSILKAKGGDDAFLNFSYTGVIELTPAIGKVLSGAPDAATTPFGSALTHVLFESGHPSLAPLEHKVFVGSGRFVIAAGEPIAVEYKISEVTA